MSNRFPFIVSLIDGASLQQDPECKMVEWISQGADATLPPAPGIFHMERHDGAVVKVFDLPEGCEDDPEQRKKIVNEIRGCLSRGQAVIVRPWKASNGRRWQWNDDDFARLSGGATANGERSLNREVGWQCEFCNFWYSLSLISLTLHVLLQRDRRDSNNEMIKRPNYTSGGHLESSSPPLMKIRTASTSSTCR